ncbi:MAG: ribulokinase, partial [Candidatus Paceibacterota bacterium]
MTTDDQNNSYVIGVDFGTDSVRALLLDTGGGVVAESVFNYPRWAEGLYCDPAQNRFRQHPLDYIEGIGQTIRELLKDLSDEQKKNIRAISVDTTGSTPVAVNDSGTPLALTEGFEENPNAMFILWKDHTAIREADEINSHSTSWRGTDYTKYVGGIYSSEWFWAKILHTLREDKQVREAATSWAEHCDWIPFELTGGTDVQDMKRSRCAAGHKAMWHEEFEGLPSEEYLSELDPLLSGLRDRLYRHTHTSDKPAGTLSGEWANKLGLHEEVVVGVGAFDAHMGAVGGEIEPYYLSRVMGTSTCDMLVAPPEDLKGKPVKGICGQVEGSILPGMTGLEAGQSAFGDVYAWFQELLYWPLERIIGNSDRIDEDVKEVVMEEVRENLLQELSDAAQHVEPQESGIVALD